MIGGWITLAFCIIAQHNDGLMFYDLIVKPELKKLSIRPEPQELFMREESGFENDLAVFNLDGPIRQSLLLLESLDAQRQQLFPEGLKKNLPLLVYKFELACRNLRGEVQDQYLYEVFVHLAAEPGKAIIISKRGGKHFFPIAGLRTDPRRYQAYLQRFVAPITQIRLRHPSLEQFLVDLYYQWPEKHKKFVDLYQPGIFHSPVFQLKHGNFRVKVHLSTSYCSWERGAFTQFHSEHLHYFSGANRTFAEVSQFKRQGRDLEALTSLEHYVHKVPNDKDALTSLMYAYRQKDQKAKASHLITENLPFFRAAVDDGVLAGYRQEIEDRRRALYRLHHEFEKNPDADLTIEYPLQDQVLAGNEEVRFSIAGQTAPLLRADLFLNDRLVGHIEKAPWAVPFELMERRRHQNLKLVTYFEDRTFQEEEIPIQVIPIFDEEEVRLMQLRAVVAKGGAKFLVNLRKDDFSLVENGEERVIQHFKKDQAPLRVALLIDTSSSMVGRKLYQAQFAVDSFLSQLGADDQASVYTFDQKVLRMSGFTNNFGNVRPGLFTLSPMLLTSLYDVIYVAHQDLLDQAGTKVMVLVSDGVDSISTTTAQQIRTMLQDSPVMIYSIVLDDAHVKKAMSGNSFLKEISEMTGSVYTEVQDSKLLDKTFSQIYNELKSFYFLDFYTRESQLNATHLKLDAACRGCKARFRLMSK